MLFSSFQTAQLFVEPVGLSTYELITASIHANPFYQFAVTPLKFHTPVYNTFYFIAYPIGSKNWRGFIKGYYAPQTHSFWIQTFVIDEAYGGLGYGSELLEGFLAALHRDNPDHQMKLYVSVLSENIRGVHFWIKNGFAKIKELTKPIYHENDAITIYSKPLLNEPIERQKPC